MTNIKRNYLSLKNNMINTINIRVDKNQILIEAEVYKMGNSVEYIISIAIDREDEEEHDIKEIIEDTLEMNKIYYGRVSVIQRAVL